jgi:hypothetical protein
MVDAAAVGKDAEGERGREPDEIFAAGEGAEIVGDGAHGVEGLAGALLNVNRSLDGLEVLDVAEEDAYVIGAHSAEGVCNAVGCAFAGERIVEFTRDAREYVMFDNGFEDIGIGRKSLEHDELLVEAEDGNRDSAGRVFCVLQ